MKNQCVVEQKTLLAILSSMQAICSKRTVIDATSYILFHVGHRELQLKSTDLEISLQSSCPLNENSSDEPVQFLVSGRRIFDVVKELEGDIRLTFDGQSLVLAAGGVHLTLNVRDAQEFPPFPERIENLMSFEANSLLEMLNKVSFLIPQNNANPALNGLLLEITDSALKMTTTDGHCLAQVTSFKYKLDVPKKWLLPRRAVLEIKKLIEGGQEQAIFLGVCNNQVVLSGAHFNFFTKVLADSFPQYTAILDKNGFMPAQVDRTHFMKTLRRSSCLLSGQFIATKFDFSKEALQVSMHNKDVGRLEERLLLEGFEADPMEVRFYAPYLLNGLQAFTRDSSTFYLKNPSRPIIFESQEPDFTITYLVMPVSPAA